MEPNQSSSLFSLTIDPLTKEHLSETAKWARFLAIAGMIVVLLVLAFTIYSVTVLGGVGLPGSNDLSGNPNFVNSMRIGAIGGAIVMLAIAFFPLLFLLRFANGMRSAIASNDQNRLNAAFQNLKIYFRYLGIVVLIVMILYTLIFVFAIMGITAFSK